MSSQQTPTYDDLFDQIVLAYGDAMELYNNGHYECADNWFKVLSVAIDLKNEITSYNMDTPEDVEMVPDMEADLDDLIDTTPSSFGIEDIKSAFAHYLDDTPDFSDIPPTAWNLLGECIAEVANETVQNETCC